MTLLRSASYVVGTFFGAGRAPFAPGTVGAIATVPLHLLLCRLNPLAHIASVAVTTAVGVWVSQVIADAEGVKDPGHVVIDEVAGTLIAMGLVRSRSMATQLAALALFRLFDIWKPGPISDAETLNPAGFGIMADDLLAGIVAGLVARRFF